MTDYIRRPQDTKASTPSTPEQRAQEEKEKKYAVMSETDVARLSPRERTERGKVMASSNNPEIRLQNRSEAANMDKK